MTAPGQTRLWGDVRSMSGLTPESGRVADIRGRLKSAANKRHSLNREEGLQAAGGRIAPPEVGSDSGRHQALGAERAAAAFSWSAPRGVAHLGQYTATRPRGQAAMVGTVSPSVLAVVRLIIGSNLVGSWTGRSVGFAPLRMRQCTRHPGDTNSPIQYRRTAACPSFLHSNTRRILT